MFRKFPSNNTLYYINQFVLKLIDCVFSLQCKSGECLQRNLVCNNIMDCADGSDEKSCGLCLWHLCFLVYTLYYGRYVFNFKMFLFTYQIYGSVTMARNSVPADNVYQISIFATGNLTVTTIRTNFSAIVIHLTIFFLLFTLGLVSCSSPCFSDEVQLFQILVIFFIDIFHCVGHVFCPRSFYSNAPSNITFIKLLELISKQI